MSQPISPQKSIKRSPLQGFLPFFWMALAFTSGILVEDLLKIPGWPWAVSFVLILLLVILAVKLPASLIFTHRLRRWLGMEKRLPNGILLALVCLGGWRLALTQPTVDPGYVGYYNDRGTVQLIGTILDAPDPRDSYSNLTVRVDSLRPLEAAPTQVQPVEITGKVVSSGPTR